MTVYYIHSTSFAAVKVNQEHNFKDKLRSPLSFDSFVSTILRQSFILQTWLLDPAFIHPSPVSPAPSHPVQINFRLSGSLLGQVSPKVGSLTCTTKLHSKTGLSPTTRNLGRKLIEVLI